MRAPFAIALLCSFGAAADATSAYHGSVGKLEIFARLSEAPDGAVTGRYFYAAKGLDLELRGERRGSEVTLVERAGGKDTGRFSGTIRANGISGEWSAGKKKLRFTLAPVSRKPQEPVLVARRRLVALRDGCRLDFAWPELFGMPDARIEDALNDKLRPKPETCEGAGEHVRDFAVHANRAGILSLSLESHGFSEGAARPYAALGSFNVATRSGQMVGWKDVFKPGTEAALGARLEPMIAAAVAATPGTDAAAADILRQALTPPGADFFLEEKGIRFNAWGALPHAFQALAAQQEFFLSYAELKPLLVETGDASALWTP